MQESKDKKKVRRLLKEMDRDLERIKVGITNRYPDFPNIKCTARLNIPDNRLLKEMDWDLKRMNIIIRDGMDIRPTIKISIRLYI